jgi:KaiC/GvpD/RAD55 family RecA-like ATPase
MIKRVVTNIPGLDEILNGGIPERNVVLLSGGPGTGKTILS